MTVCERCRRIVEIGAVMPFLGEVTDFTVCDLCAEQEWLENERRKEQDYGNNG